MCGRFTLATPADELKKHFNLFTLPELVARYNITPSQPILTIHSIGEETRGELLRWGLIPRWAKDAKIGYRLANARAETIHEKASFKHAIRRRRCVVPVDGYYEWKKEDGGKQPYFFHRRTQGGRGLLALAAIWETWRDPETGEDVRTCALITTSPNAVAAAIHHRMPVILPEQTWKKWHNPKTPLEEVLSLLVPYTSDDLTVYPVHRRVNSPREDDPGVIEPLHA